MSKRMWPGQLNETRRWFEQERLRRTEAARRAARDRQPVEGFAVIKLPSIADGLDELDAPATRYAGSEA